MWLSIFRYIHKHIDDGLNVFEHFWVARDLFAFAFPVAFGSCFALSVLSRLLPCTPTATFTAEASIAQQQPHLQPPGKSPAITAAGVATPEQPIGLSL